MSNVFDMDEYLVGKSLDCIDDFNKILEHAYQTLSEEEFADFADHFLAEMKRLTKLIKERE